MKKRILTIIMALLICGSITGCGKSADTANQNKGQQTESSEKSIKPTRNEKCGLEFTRPQVWNKYHDSNLKFNLKNSEWGGAEGGSVKWMFNYEFIHDVDKVNEIMDRIGERTEISEEEAKNMNKEYEKYVKPVCEVMVVDKTVNNNAEMEEIFSKYECQEKMASQDNLDYYLVYNNKFDDKDLSDDAKKAYKEIFEHIKDIKSTVKTFKPIKSEEKMGKYKNIEFNTKTIDGKEISSNIFKDNKLTMINIWNTSCGPCIAEMPDLQKLYEEVKNEKVNVISIITDTPDEDTEALAKEILKKKGVNFISIMPDENLKNGILKDIPGTPTTIFVDSNGNIVGKYIVGGRGKDEYKKAINSILETLK